MILAVDATSQPHRWITWQDAVTLKCKGMVQYDFGDREFMFTGGKSRLTGEISKVEVASMVVLKAKALIRHRVPSLTNRNLFGRDLHLCAYCGSKHSFYDLTRDHIIPVSRGGANTWMNCVTACKICNTKKAARTPEEFGSLLLYVPYVPDRAEGLIMQNRHILADQMQFLANFLPKHSRLHKLNLP